MDKMYVFIVAFGVSLGAVGTTEAMNVQLGTQQSAVTPLLYHAERGHEGFMLNLDITENDMRALCCVQVGTKETEITSAPVQGVPDKKTVKKRAGKTTKYCIKGYKVEDPEGFFRFKLNSK